MHPGVDALSMVQFGQEGAIRRVPAPPTGRVGTDRCRGVGLEFQELRGVWGWISAR